jgi:hypothetical chaperone protein
VRALERSETAVDGISIGLDFGTSNSAVALPAGPDGLARIIDIDAQAEDARLLRSVLFFPDDSQEILSGEEAIQRYLAEGEGRFLQSMKSFLPSTSFQRTEIRHRSWTLEAIVGVLLRQIRVRVEASTNAKIERAVFGRPAVFSPDPAKDLVAENRLSAAAELAGFPKPTFVIEPIAAALRYEESLTHDEIVLVGDFGAGTSDFTLMRLGPTWRGQPNRKADVIASSGVYVGGDRFDATIVEHKLLERFGAGSTYKSMLKRLPIPGWMTRKLLSWHELSLLRERSTMEFLQQALKTSDAPRALQNLITLASENLAYRLYRSVEQAKRMLSGHDEATVSFHEADIDVEEQVTRAEFERWSAPLRQELIGALDLVLARGQGVEPDAVFLTGGTSKIPSVRQVFIDRFGSDRLREGDAFTSVAAGLGAAAGLGSLGEHERWDAALRTTNQEAG